MRKATTGNRQAGYVLVLTIWILALMTLSVSYFSLWMDQLITGIETTSQNLQDQRDQVSTQSLVYYIISTTKAELKGIALPNQDLRDTEEPQFLRIDGTPYLGLGEVCFSLQDEGGLVRQRQLFERYSNLLNRMGVPAGDVPPLTAKFFDFVDTDAMKRINGAEAPEYKAKDRDEPPNRPLLTSWELRHVLDWDGYPELWAPLPIPRLLTVQEIGGLLNFNYAPRELLLAVPGVGPEEADSIIAEREREPFLSVERINDAAGKQLDINEMEMLYTPSRFLRLTLWSRKGFEAREIVYEMAPAAKAFTSPIDMDYVVYLPKKFLGENLLRKGNAISESVF